MSRRYRTCPACGRRFEKSGWQREYDYQEHLCLPRLARGLRRLGLLLRRGRHPA